MFAVTPLVPCDPPAYSGPQASFLLGTRKLLIRSQQMMETADCKSQATVLS